MDNSVACEAFVLQDVFIVCDQRKFLIPNEPLTPKRTLYLGFAVVRVALAFVERTDEGDASLVGYLMALVAAFGWAGRAPSACATRIGK